jgi:hypothetical protein
MRNWKEFYKNFPKSAKRLWEIGEVKFGGKITEVDMMPVSKNGEESLCITLDYEDFVIHVNKTNAALIAARHGDDVDKWVGKKVLIEVIDTKFAGANVKGLKITPVK